MQKTNWVAFVGLPNVGKSTLVNQLVGEKVSIVTPKAQTTRHSLKGIKVEGDTQLIFIDTPGIFEARTAVEKLMVKLAWRKMGEANEICVMVDSKKALDKRTRQLLSQLDQKKLVYNLVINKIDKISKPELLSIATELNKLCHFKNTFMISALKNSGVDVLFKYFMKTAKEGPWFFAKDEITNAPLYFMAAEIVREKIFFNTHQELPYNTCVETMHWEEKENITVINVSLIVKNISHKKIIIGKQGALLKKIGTHSRKEIEKLLEKKVFLSLHVKVSPLDNHRAAKNLSSY
jgi:GTPase